VARASGASTIVLLGDSAALINQVNSRSKPRDAEISALVVRFQEEALHFQRLRVRHVRRTQNLAGIALAKLREVARDAELRHRV
jgi:ribonuclease HI